MDVKGDLSVKRTMSASRRVNEGLSSETLAGARTVVIHDYAILNLNPNGANRDVNLPDATTLPVGWSIKVRHSGAANDLVVKDNGGGTLKTISLPLATAEEKMYEFTLLTNGVAAGTWHVTEMGDPGVIVASRFVNSFVVADWSAPSGGYRTLTVTAGTHGRGANPSVQVQELIGSDFDKVLVDRERLNASGDLELRIVDGAEFDGRIIFV